MKEQQEEVRRENAARIIYDWIHESQVTHRRRYDAIPEEQKQTYRTVADKVIESIASQDERPAAE